MIFAVTAVAAVTEQGVRLGAFGLAAMLLPVERLRRRLEHQMLLDVEPQSLATLLETDLLTIVLHASVPGAEAFGAVLTLTRQRFAAAADSAAMLAARRLAILAKLHASGPSSTMRSERRRMSANTHQRQAIAGDDGGDAAFWSWVCGRNRLVRPGVCLEEVCPEEVLEAELAVRRLSAPLAAFLDGLLALKLEDRDDAALVDVPA